MLELLAELDMITTNVGNSPTFERGGSVSNIDITCVLSKVAHRVEDWQVMNEKSGSDHRLITFVLKSEKPQSRNEGKLWSFWRYELAKKSELEKYFASADVGKDFQGLDRALKAACVKCLKRTFSCERWRPNPWWSDVTTRGKTVSRQDANLQGVGVIKV